MRSFGRWKANVLAQTRQPDEIVVVDAYSNDGTAEHLFEWAAADPRVKVVQESGAAAHGRNHAIEQARFEHILSTDMGIRLNEIWCEELIAPFEANPGIEVVVGNTCIDKESLVSAAARAEYYLEPEGIAAPGPGVIALNRSVAYTKSVWRRLGGLPEDLTFYADDSVFGLQMLQEKLLFAYAPEAMTYWSRPGAMRLYWKEQFNYGKGDGEAWIKIPFAFRLYQKGILPRFLVPLANACRTLQKRLRLQAIGRCLKQADLGALAAMPVLAFGQGWNHAKGYLLGFDHGNEHCLRVRARLSAEYRK